MAWTKPLYDRQRVNKAGHALVDNQITDDEKYREFAVVNNWRSAHGYPLQCIKMVLKGRAQKIDSKSIIAQRLKRFPSIQAKLKRERSMRLTQMQDIGGCRAVVSNIKQVDQLVKLYQKATSKNPRGRHIQAGFKNYIDSPKVDGYRCVHIIYKYRSGASKHRVYNDLKIEIQVRSKLQHAWATAVEIVDAFTGQALKSGLKLNLGDPDWRRFFALMGSAIAIREKRPLVPGTPANPADLKRELKHLTRKLRVVSLLSGLSVGLKAASGIPNASAYLLILNLEAMEISVTPFTKEKMPFANEEYLKAEKEAQDKPQVLSVLVAVESIKALRTAYPNYYLDASAFIDALNKAIE